MNKLSLRTAALGLLSFAEVSAQDVMHYRLKHLKVLAEDEKVRVLKYSPEREARHQEGHMLTVPKKREGQVVVGSRC
jgi:hypothetical protein